MDPVPLLAAVALGYLVGSIPIAVLVARARGFDPRDVGDRNPGYWNMKEQLGRRASLPVFVGDMAKGVAAGMVGAQLDASGWGIGYLAVGAAMLGHAYPVFAGFRGGRSILTFAGGMAVLVPGAFLFALLALTGVSLISGSFAMGVLVAVFGFPVLQLLFTSKEQVAATGGLMAIIGFRFALAALADRRSVGTATATGDQR